MFVDQLIAALADLGEVARYLLFRLAMTNMRPLRGRKTIYQAISTNVRPLRGPKFRKIRDDSCYLSDLVFSINLLPLPGLARYKGDCLALNSHGSCLPNDTQS